MDTVNFNAVIFNTVRSDAAPFDAAGGTRPPGYRPTNTGFRFSPNARTPSL